MTPFGEKLRQMRAERRISLKTMAGALGVTSAYLSALEHGKRGAPPWYFVQKIIVFFNIIWDDAEELQRLAIISDPKPSVDTAGLSPVHTELANRLAADIARLSPEDAARMLASLKATITKV